jgi:secreted trypsin-like serine protease
LISDRFVLSAAHCEQSNRLSPSTVRLGEHNLAVQDRGSPEIDIPIEKFIAHEKYNRETKENDIAVIKMVRSVPFSRKIRPACLPDPAIPNQKPKAVATGWGRITTFTLSFQDLN